NMAILRCDHPDLLEFVHCKRDGSIANFNISVAITDAFMRALDHREKCPLLAQPGWPLPGGARARGGEILGELDAGEVWRTICEAAWATGDPGLFFIDHVNASPANAVPALQTIEASNPCGEQSLPPYGACTLGQFALTAAQQASHALACERGSFPWFAQSIYKDGPPRRNSNITTIAPTGTVSIIAGCSSGIEPLFALAFQHRVRQPDGSTRVL